MTESPDPPAKPIDANAQHEGDHPEDLTPIHYLSGEYRMLASLSTGSERREALLRSAAAWHSWPATSFTKREEQKDRDAAGQ